MTRIRLNKGNLYPTGGTKQAGHKDPHFKSVCKGCGKVILKSESRITIPGDGDYCGDCIPSKMEV